MWPRGLLAPLLQWSPSTAGHAYDAVYVHLQENGFEYQGYFAANGAPFVNTPIPQLAWQTLSYSNSGDPVTVTLVFSSNGVAYGPLTETWKIAKGSLTGTVYYNSYGTNLAHNLCCTIGGAKFGGATLAIKHGATSPVLVAGSDSECRVCHSVSADGSRLVTVRGDSSNYDGAAWYDLDERLRGDGDVAERRPLRLPRDVPRRDDADERRRARLARRWARDERRTDGGAALRREARSRRSRRRGIPAGLQAGSPVFSPDGKHVAFNFTGGTVNGTAADGVSLAAMDFDPASKTFSNFRVLYKPPSGTSVWPSFLPTNDAVVFELEVEEQRPRLGRHALALRQRELHQHAEHRHAGRALVGRPRDRHGGAPRSAQRQGLPADAPGQPAHGRRRCSTTSRR